MAEGWVVPCTIGDKPKTVVLKTAGKYVDKDIILELPAIPEEVVISSAEPDVENVYPNAKIWIEA